jgi:signal transduction histidine kinase
MTESSAPLSPEILTSRLGDYLVENKLITALDLNEALEAQKSLRAEGKPSPLLGEILLEMKRIDRTTLDSAITKQILQLKAALIESNQHLEQRVKVRTAELEQALRKLSELNQLKSNFVANISHELRTPMTHLKGYLELLITQDLGALNASQVQAMQIMQRSSERLERLIEDLIQFSMAERDEVSLRVRNFNLGTLCLNLVNRLQPKAKAAQVTVHFQTQPDIPTVSADEEKISWVILQLMDNAIKFTPAGGSVHLSLEQDSKFVRVSVRDTGIGIPPDRIEEIFQPFHQLDSSSTRRYAGTGLGLALVKKIIESHGSVIHVTSQVDQGSVFEFLIGTSEIVSQP